MGEEKEIIIDGIDVSECPLFDKKTGCYHTFDGECVKESCALYKWLLKYKRLQEENEELKTYIQKMDKPEIKTIDSEIALKNIGLQKENEKLKEYIKNLQVRKDRYYLQVLEYERQVNDWINFYIKVRDIISGNYEILDGQRLQDLRRIMNEVLNDRD